MPLTDAACKRAEPAESPQKLTDGRGLYLLVLKAGKYWRFDYRFAGKRKTISFGIYPDVSLRAARERLEAARHQLNQGDDPSPAKAQAAARARQAHDFESVARDWHARLLKTWKPDHAATILRRLETQVFPDLGGKPIAEIEARDLLVPLRKIEARGANELAHKMMQTCGQVFRYGIATGACKHDVAASLRGALSPAVVQHHAAVTEPLQIKRLVRAIDTYKSPVTRLGLQLAALLFLRPGELRHGAWSEVDLDGAEWRIPGPRMKMGSPHIVPLSKQAVARLRELEELTGYGPLMFPGVRPGRVMCENTMVNALRRLGFEQGVMTSHGFRAMASTRLHEMGWSPMVIERQLAHAEPNKVAAAYNRAEFLAERRQMMQAWADYLDQLRAE